MTMILKTNSEQSDFHLLTNALDQELAERYGLIQKENDQHNIIEFNDRVVIVFHDNIPVGCGCYKEIDKDTIEIKRMFIRKEFRGKGISKVILNTLEEWSVENKFKRAVLETGIYQPEAIGLYEKSGYNRIDNYGPYVGNTLSVCMEKKLIL